MSKARIIAYLLFILLMLAGWTASCGTRDANPERSPQTRCYRWNNDGTTETECGLQTGVQPAPSVTP